jgi:hypothetical protein
MNLKKTTEHFLRNMNLKKTTGRKQSYGFFFCLILFWTGLDLTGLGMFTIERATELEIEVTRLNEELESVRQHKNSS